MVIYQIVFCQKLQLHQTDMSCCNNTNLFTIMSIKYITPKQKPAKMEDKYKTPISDMDIYKKPPNSNKTPSRHGQNTST